MDESLICDHGGYRHLKSFQIAQLCYDVTVRFGSRYVEKRSRTYDQMIQAARSGVQNIAEGSRASGTSKKSELKLTNVARASLEELRLDYEDFLRQRGLRQWPSSDPWRLALVQRRCSTADEVAQWVKEICLAKTEEDRPAGPSGPDRRSSQTMGSIGSMQSIRPARAIQSLYREASANAALVLIGVASALLKRQIEAQAKAFETEGGFTERLYRIRMRNKKSH